MTERPIEIIGGGLAGLSLGIALRRARVPVTLHEAGDYPRHRVCGEFIAGLAQSTIDHLGLSATLADTLHHSDVAWFAGASAPQIQRLPAPALALSRHVLDARLAHTFASLGGTLLTRSRVVDQTPCPGRIIATGRRRATDAGWIGLKVHVRPLRLTRDLEMHLGAECYVGLCRLADNEVNICGLFRRRAIHDRGPSLLLRYLHAAGLEALAGRIAGAPADPESFSAVAALDFDQRVQSGTALCLGDSGALIPPFTGNGMAMAFQSAEVALPRVLAYARGETDWAHACRVTNDALRRRFRLRLASASALHSFLLRPRRQRWFAALGRAQLLPFRPLYATLH